MATGATSSPVAQQIQRQISSALRGQITTGNIFYVNSNAASPYGADSTASAVGTFGRGRSPSYPFLTLNYAISQCTAANGDVVIVMPGHAEALSAAAAIAVSKSGITIIGVGNGRARPTFTWGTSTAATMTVTAANVMFKNCVFDFTGIDALVVGISVDAADVWFDSCEFITNSATAGCVSGITVGGTTTSPRFGFTNNRVRGPAINAGTTTTGQLTLTDCPDYEIRDSYFTGKCTQNITNGATILRGEIGANRFVTYTGTKAINMAAASTPFISNNRINVPSGTAPIVAAAGFVSGNNYSAAAGVAAGTASTI